MTFAKYLMAFGVAILALGILFIASNISTIIEMPNQSKSGNVITGAALLVIGTYVLTLSYFEN